MANELSVNYGINYSKGTTNPDTDQVARSFSITVSGDPRTSGVQTIGTTEEQLVLGDVSSVGVVEIFNLDSTNYLEVGGTTGVYTLKILPGEGYVYRSTTNNVYCKANTAAVKVAYKIFSA